MTAPQWWSQPFPPTGAIASEGIRNQLGRPPVDPLTVFVRETAQNSWDARLPGLPTTYRLELTTVSPTHRPAWERLLTPPPPTQPFLGVGRAVGTPNLRLLSVVDRGTKGLGGPTRADELADDRRDWVSFVLNVGEKRDTFQGGGTYGYGKAVLYRLSKVGTILVYTRTEVPGQGPTSRLIGIALGDSYDSRQRADAEARPYTGRHWWGDVQGEHVEPLVGAEADGVARMLGLRPFADHESGTTLTVLDPDLEDFADDIDAAARHLADTIAWQMWPIMLPERGDRRLTPEVVAGGRTFEVPDPARTYPLRMFVSAYRRLPTERAMTLECKSPRKPLGRFALERAVVVPMSPDSVTQAAEYAGVGGDPHHVCLMRSPELVVRYHEGPVPGSVNKAYAGVFRADDELDDIYAAAEPPTHDQWVHEQLTGHAKTFVRVTFTRLREQLSAFRAPAATATTTSSGVALGAASNFLGGLVAAAFAEPDSPATGGGSGGGRGGVGGSAGGGRPGRPSPVPRERVRVAAVGEPRVEDRDGSVVVAQRFAVSGPGPIRLDARLAVATWEGREEEAPAGAPRPRVRCWVTPTGERRGDVCVVDSPAEVDLLVDPVPDTVTDIGVVGATVGEDAT
ncbi:hypothetical protein [Pseudonocardia sp. D17]|uniref:hypothetical protein n=1 Tax=Pseudonocardia sp. D17 TaxID=882661 RepID=UPI0030D13524